MPLLLLVGSPEALACLRTDGQRDGQVWQIDRTKPFGDAAGGINAPDWLRRALNPGAGAGSPVRGYDLYAADTEARTRVGTPLALTDCLDAVERRTGGPVRGVWFEKRLAEEKDKAKEKAPAAALSKQAAPVQQPRPATLPSPSRQQADNPPAPAASPSVLLTRVASAPPTAVPAVPQQPQPQPQPQQRRDAESSDGDADEASADSSTTAGGGGGGVDPALLETMVRQQQSVIESLGQREMLLLRRLLEYEATFKEIGHERSTAASADAVASANDVLSSMVGGGELHRLMGDRELSPEQASLVARRLLEHYTEGMPPEQHGALLGVLAHESVARHIIAPDTSPLRQLRHAQASPQQQQQYGHHHHHQSPGASGGGVGPGGDVRRQSIGGPPHLHQTEADYLPQLQPQPQPQFLDGQQQAALHGAQRPRPPPDAGYGDDMWRAQSFGWMGPASPLAAAAAAVPPSAAAARAGSIEERFGSVDRRCRELRLLLEGQAQAARQMESMGAPGWGYHINPVDSMRGGGGVQQ